MNAQKAIGSVRNCSNKSDIFREDFSNSEELAVLRDRDEWLCSQFFSGEDCRNSQVSVTGIGPQSMFSEFVYCAQIGQRPRYLILGLDRFLTQQPLGRKPQHCPNNLKCDGQHVHEIARRS
jgi:hypothetical protein